MIRKHVTVLGLIPAVLVVVTTPAFAQVTAVDEVWVEANCQGYNGLDVLIANPTPNTTYTINYSLTVTCSNNGLTTSQTISGAPQSFTTPSAESLGASTTYDMPYSFTEGWSNPTAISGNCIVMGTATITDTATGSTTTVPIFVNNSQPGRATMTCPGTPTACVLPPSGTAIGGAPVSWNGFTAPTGSVAWINAHLDAKNVPTNTITTVDFTGVTLVVNSTSYALPNGQVVFNPATTTPSTVVNADGSWTTTVNPTFNNDVFFVGQAIPVDANMENGGHGNTGSTLSFSTNSSDSTLQFQWQWSAAVYTSWPGNAAADIEPVHAQQQAGAPLNTAVEAGLIQGPRGGGGSNFTGSWSGTGQGNCPQ